MDFATFSEVRARIGGVKGVIRALGDAPPFDHKWGSFPKCPFCDHKDSAGVFLLNGADHFKCHYTSCSTGGRVVTETGYINLREGLSEDTPAEGGPSPAYKRLLELAGAYVQPRAEDRRAENGERKEGTSGEGARGVSGGAPDTAREARALPDVPLVTEPADDVALIRQAIELIRKEKTASLRMLQSGLRLGYGRALRIMDGLERWGVVGPSVPGEKFRVVLNLPEAGAPPPVQSVGVIEPGSDNPVAETVPEGGSSSGPAFINDGVPGSPGSPPLANGGPVPPQLSQQKPPSVPPVLAAPGAGQAGKLDEKPALAPGYAALRWFYDRLFPTSSQMQAYMPDGSAVPSPLPKMVMKKIKFRPVSLDEKRMLPPVACEALGLRANPRANEATLLEMEEVFDWEERRASGLWVDADHKREQGRRPNDQYHGKGQVGKKPLNERQHEGDNIQWGWCEPVLIPYFNEAGELVKLRPHKGGASGETAAGSARVYVPRDHRTAADRVEKFYTVIICEGEYKAAVIWFIVGAGAVLRGSTDYPVGVCALPGISFAKSPSYRAELDEWLRAVDCQKVIVAFDDEDKSHKPLRGRHDSTIWARYLATSLSLELKIPALYLPLPKAWRVNGKADWDGAAVKQRDEGRAAQ